MGHVAMTQLRFLLSGRSAAGHVRRAGIAGNLMARRKAELLYPIFAMSMNEDEQTRKAIARLRAASSSAAECRRLQKMMAQYVKQHATGGRLYLAPDGDFWVSFGAEPWPNVQVCAIRCGEVPDEGSIEASLDQAADALDEDL
jgi:glucose/arabinose dehydrogenase